ncbi:DUF2513 domain-containing protein [Crocosphaera sp. UHCC 0190]|uniref:DUF2513 domain-containing protein n=1 Tax=Crocosphaera sp. UHCC 0190 TaxID=3110246 RepID=UPI002B2151DB|nr:DUF2513 domain-containing protein [Crocosphaera sp. UHCC 0190]MEA5509159.1 DUF2513 domain-containing protein [Crocosphaera sp. UHCC 0190]
MKRDWNLFVDILKDIESSSSGKVFLVSNHSSSFKITYTFNYIKFSIEQYELQEIYDHVLLLKDENLIEIEHLKTISGGIKTLIIHRLTSEGHNFLDKTRDKDKLQKAIKLISEKGGGAISVGLITQVLSALAKQGLGLN